MRAECHRRKLVLDARPGLHLPNQEMPAVRAGDCLRKSRALFSRRAQGAGIVADRPDAFWSLNSHTMPWKLPHYYVDSLSTQNGDACHRSREPRSSGFAVRTAETGVGGAARMGLRIELKCGFASGPAGGGKPVSKNV